MNVRAVKWSGALVGILAVIALDYLDWFGLHGGAKFALFAAGFCAMWAGEKALMKWGQS